MSRYRTNDNHHVTIILIIYVFTFQKSTPVVTVLMEMFVWWEVPTSMRVEWRCASMTSGGQCVMTPGTALMLLWSAGSWDMHTQEVSLCNIMHMDLF